MFDSMGWGEIIVILLAALFIFGPERLPSLARDAAGVLGHVRKAISDARGQLEETLGDDLTELRSLDLRRYNPRTVLREQLLGDDEADLTPVRSSGSRGASTAVDR
jgi:sec-independent protein translocase protein TatB